MPSKSLQFSIMIIFNLLQLHSDLYCDLTALTLVERSGFSTPEQLMLCLLKTYQIIKIRKLLSSEVYLGSEPNG